jgi:DNA invertase Pin-like site-specific DNA recombinase
LAVTKLDRLARSTLDLLRIVDLIGTRVSTTGQTLATQRAMLKAVRHSCCAASKRCAPSGRASVPLSRSRRRDR